jgi:GTPase
MAERTAEKAALVLPLRAAEAQREEAEAAEKGEGEAQTLGESVEAEAEAASGEEDAEALRTLRIAFVGNVDSGKSSLIGTLIKGELDDGRGSSRKAVFRHKHEVESGRTSSVATAYLGFDAAGEQILSRRAGKLLPWVELAKVAHKRIQLIDLAGAHILMGPL